MVWLRNFYLGMLSALACGLLYSCTLQPVSAAEQAVEARDLEAAMEAVKLDIQYGQMSVEERMRGIVYE